MELPPLLRVSALVWLLAGLFPSSARAQEPGRLALGIHPYKAPSQLYEAFGPLADYLSRRLGRPVDIKISTDYRTHVELIGKNGLDMAYMGPASYVKLVRGYGPQPILVRQAIDGKPTFRGVIAVRRDSPLQSLTELNGRRFAFGDPQSTMSHLVPRHMLLKAGIGVGHLSGYRFLAGHDDVALAVLAGHVAAGAVKEAVFEKYAPRGLRRLATTPDLSEHLLVTRSDLDGRLVTVLRNTLLSLKDSPDGRAALQAIKPHMTAMVPAGDSDYDNLRQILETLKGIGVEP